MPKQAGKLTRAQKIAANGGSAPNTSNYARKKMTRAKKARTTKPAPQMAPAAQL